VPAVKTRFIVNPRSGHVARVLARVQAAAAELRAEVVFTERPRHATELAATALADGCALVVAVGGDGTLNEVAGALVGTAATFGLVPCGSGNGLGRHLGIHGPVDQALRVLRTGASRLIDSGLADGHAFFTVAGLGFEAEVSDRFNRLARRGFRRYLATAAALLRTYRSPLCTIEHDGMHAQLPVFTLAVANCDQYGNRARIAPGAQVDDGRLDLVAIPPVSWANAVPLIARLFSGTIDRARNVTHFRGARFVVHRPAPGLIHTDGECHFAPARIEFIVRPQSLRVLAPAATPAR
jgi:YegS/Rv2252/BmrU family lipid kinase